MPKVPMTWDVTEEVVKDGGQIMVPARMHDCCSKAKYKTKQAGPLEHGGVFE